MEEVLNGDKPARIAFAGRVAGRELISHMSAEDQVDILEQTGSDVERFCSAEFFSNAGDNLDGAGEMMFVHQFFQDQRGGDVNSHAGVVPFAVAGRSLDYRGMIGNAGLLRSARNAI